MKILHTADWHIGSFPGPEKDGVNLRAADTGMCLNHMHEMALIKKPDLMVVSGDVFHQARVWADRGLDETKTAIQAIEAFSDLCPVVVLRGTPNHDGEEQFEMLKAHFRSSQRVTIATEPGVFAIPLDTAKMVITVAALPGFDRGAYRAKFPGLSKEEENQVFTEELGKIILGLRAQCGSLPSVLISHYTVPGCNTESGQTQFLAQFEPVIMPEVLDTAGFDLVALGHIHRPQKLQSCRNTYYSGAINALNFNDEGQDRGFWIHDLSAGAHDFYKSPSREFLTIRLGHDEVMNLNHGGIDDAARRGTVSGKIVRVLYSCTEEESKALNRPVLEKQLYDDGAFSVSEISPEKITVSTNKNELSEKTDPEANLIDYLNEKAYPDDKIKSIMEAAAPIVSEATAGIVTSRLTGIFVPLDIEVKNYRNYEEERFCFRDITFCTINGKNGAGKSSLFMDAILDCLYEEPREGDLTGWIRAGESARSGLISFTFMIGDKTFRVTRTRAKSGKATLNISEKADDEWVNRSAEKIRDTQDKIVDILGMDSLTFRSCALIMQDQYGLFLQADKEDRMTILGNILGLGIYSDMEQLSRNRVTDLNRIISQKKFVMEGLAADVSGAGEIETKFCERNDEAEKSAKEIETLSLARDNIRLQLSGRLEAAQRAAKVRDGIGTLTVKEAAVTGQIGEQEAIVRQADGVLANEQAIEAGIQGYDSLLAKEKETLAQISALAEKSRELPSLQTDIKRCESDALRANSARQEVAGRISAIGAMLQKEPELKQAFDRLWEEKKRLTTLENRSQLYITLSESISNLQKRQADAKAEFSAEAARRKTVIEGLTAKAQMLDNSRCIDPGNAKCVFLEDAIRAKGEMDHYRESCSKWKEAELTKLEDIKGGIETLIHQREAVGYDADQIQALRVLVASLESEAREYEKLDALREQLGLYKERLHAVDTSIADIAERLAQANRKAIEAHKAAESLAAFQQEYIILKSRILMAQDWLEKEKQLPIARERKAVAEKRRAELLAELAALKSELADKLRDLEKETALCEDTDRLESDLRAVERVILAKQSAANGLHAEIGALRQQLTMIELKKDQIKDFLKEVNWLAEQVSRFEILKDAFSQDGIPHNIIRSMLPMLTATANSILGQMTGGKMGMEFITDKILKSGSKKEVPALDIVVEEYGKDSLPYLSKSGGEKVKASLSAVLALAEIKSSQAGIQLGMLFIDEPPFLDGDGIQAYCDALETIQRRYVNMKIMAITHDPTMKARFPQSLDVIKTDGGSKVIFN